jgi:hypothetical protein
VDVGVAVGVAVDVGVAVGVAVAVGELLTVGVGLELGPGDGDGWFGTAEGVVSDEGTAVAVAGTVCAGATPADGLVTGAAATIMTPATIATMPPRRPAPSNSRLQEGPEFGPGTGPSSVNLMPLNGAGLARAASPQRPVLAAASAARITRRIRGTSAQGGKTPDGIPQIAQQSHVWNPGVAD